MTEVREGPPAVEVAERYGVTRQAGTAWRERYESAGLDASPTDPADATPPQLASTPTKKH